MFFQLCAAVLICSVMSDSLPPMDCSPPGSSVHGILQARILEWVAISNQGISPTQESNPHLLHCRPILNHLSHKRSPVMRPWVKYWASPGLTWLVSQMITATLQGSCRIHDHVCKVPLIQLMLNKYWLNEWMNPNGVFYQSNKLTQNLSGKYGG